MARKVKCPECGTFNDKENTVYDNGRYYCKICYKNKKHEADDYKSLIAYVCELYQIEAPTGWMLKQIRDFKEQFHYSYKGMKTTLHYFYEIQEGNDPMDSLGVGIIPFVYDEAKKFYIDRIAVKNSVSNAKMDEIENNKKVISIHRENCQSKNTYKDMSLIDITTL